MPATENSKQTRISDKQTMIDPATAHTPGLLEGFSVEITGKDVPALIEAAPLLPRGTAVNITYLANEDAAVRLRAAESVLSLGFHPVPHLSARRIGSAAELTETLAAYQQAGAVEEVFLIGGDPPSPEGPFPDALSLIETGVLEEHGVRSVGIAGYPEGHPKIADADLAEAMGLKLDAIAERGMAASIITQFGFDAEPVLGWIRGLRGRGIGAPVRVGVPGPAGIKRLLGYARRFGVASSAGIAQKYGLSLTSLIGTAGPEKFLHALDDGLEPDIHGQVLLHFYTFGGVPATARWIDDHSEEF
ncbi:methylenetetrahydrofolate reductase [Enemella evansiae]|uniref:methylenetetrahydrofolate reductase n=1 Tax=Enemella evansiae TaxID=2016499 RepID=UPI001E6572DE|nr:methylenetetrahydrofolate reductase [Enemella evansiae]